MSTVQTKPVAKHEAFVEQQLTRMRSRIRSLDAGRAVLWFFVVTLGYGLFVAGLDRVLELPFGIRLAGFVVYALAGLFFVGSALMTLYRRINPYYAARLLEETLPDAKNSVVNWLDLRDEKLPPVILNALGNRAARDLRKADPEQAVNVGPTWILASVLAGLVLGILILFVSSPRQFMSLMERAFAPFQEVGIATRTTITLIEPEGGDATVSPNRPLTFRASIDGRVPAVNQAGAPRLHFRYNPSDVFASLALEQDRDGNWAGTLAADQLLNGGLWYKITASDAETPEYQVRVVPIPQVREFAPTYRYRPYLRIPEQVHAYSPALFTGLKAPRGTEVSLVIHANCPVREGSLRVQWAEGKKEIVELPGEILPDDPLSLRFPKLLLDRDGFFTLLFVSRQGERNIDRSPHKIEIIPDLAPRVELLKPEKDVYPANGTIPLQGSARDDFGIKSLILRLQAHDQGAIHVLEPKPYRPGKSFQLVNGKYPDFLEYKDFISLDKVKTAKGQPFALKKGMALEFWLEAVDNSDFPDPNGNLGKSIAHKVLINEPDKDANKKEQEQKKAEQEAKEHQKNQDQDLERQNKAAKEEQQQANNQKTPDQKAQEKSRKDIDDQAQKLQEKLNKQDPKQDQNNGKGEAKGADGPQSDTKKGENNEAAAKDSKNEKGQDKAGEQKDAGKDGAENKPGQARDEGRKDPKDGNDKNAEAQAKGPGNDKSDAGPKGTADKNDPNPKSGEKNQDKSAAKQSPEKSTGAAKEQGKNEKGDDPGQAKQENPKEKNDPQAKGNDKQAGKEQPGAQAKDDKSGSGGQKTAHDKAEPKKGAGEQQAQAKDQGKGKEKSGKPDPQAKAKENTKESPQGSAKSDEKNSPPCNCKNGGPKSGGENSASAKGGGGNSGKNSPDKSQAKQSNPDEAKRSAQAKGDPGAEKAVGREPSLDDVNRAANDLKKKDPTAQEKAERDLSKIRRDAGDPKVRDAADDALQQANRNPARSKGTGEGEEHQAQAVPKGAGEEGPAVKGGQVKGDQPTEQPSQGKGESDKQDTAQSETKGGDKAGDFGGGQRGLGGDHKPQAPDQEAGKRGGNLTLEEMKDLIRKTGPAERKQAGVSESDWQKFLKDVQAYEQALQKQRAQAKIDKVQGATSKLKGYGPFQVGSGNTNPVDPLQAGRFLPPPEFRQAHREFTRGAPALPDNKK